MRALTRAFAAAAVLAGTACSQPYGYGGVGYGGVGYGTGGPGYGYYNPGYGYTGLGYAYAPPLAYGGFYEGRDWGHGDWRRDRWRQDGGWHGDGRGFGWNRPRGPSGQLGARPGFQPRFTAEQHLQQRVNAVNAQLRAGLAQPH